MENLWYSLSAAYSLDTELYLLVALIIIIICHNSHLFVFYSVFVAIDFKYTLQSVVAAIPNRPVQQKTSQTHTRFYYSSIGLSFV